MEDLGGRPIAGGGFFSPNPEEIGDHAEADGGDGGEDGGEEIVHADRVKNIHPSPPEDETAEVGDVVLPKAFPGGGGVAEHPAVIEEEADDGGEFGGDQGGDRHGEAGHLFEDVEEGEVKAGEKEADDPPPHHGLSEELVETGFDGKGGHGEFSERAIATGQNVGAQPGQPPRPG